MADPIDLRFQSNAPMAAIIQAYQNKAEMQEKMKMDQNAIENQNINRIAGVFQGAASLTSGLVQQAEQRQRMAALMTQVDKGGISVPVAQPTGPNASVEPSAPFADTEGQPTAPPQMQLLKDTPEWQSRTRELALSAFPKETGTALAKSLFPENASGGSGTKTSVPMPLELPDGRQTLGHYDYLTSKFMLQNGSEAPEGTKRSYKYDLREDSQGNLIVSSGASGRKVNTIDATSPATTPEETGTVNDLNKLPPVVRKEVQGRLNASSNDPELRKEKDIYVGMNRLEKAVASGNAAIASKLGIIFQKAMGDSGNIAVAEQKMPGSQQLLSQAKQIWDTYIATGALSDSNKKIVLQAITTLKEVSKENYTQLVDIETDQLVEAYPQLNRDYVRNSVGGGALMQFKKAEGAKKGGASAEDQANQFLTGLLGGPK
jgi:hypothetical protein